MRLIRVFPRRTKATPNDALAYVGEPDLYAEQSEAEEVHVSVTFSYDKLIAERLAEKWARIAPVKIGGVAYDDDSLEFIPGRYIKPGYTITSRGCPRRCWFCGVWKKWPEANPMPIYDGWNVLDDNLLACPEWHVRAVFDMLKRQGRQIEFTGGLEALALQDYQVDLLASLQPRPNMFWAYDPGDAFETLESAARRMLAAGFTAASHRLRCYVLIGYPMDTFTQAEARLNQMIGIGLTPMAMLWQPDKPSQEKWRPSPEWKRFQRRWARPAIIHRVTAADAAPKARVFLMRELYD
jgi:Fe-S oxidoreductase